MAFFTRGELQIYYEIAGAGKPLVLSHAIGRDCSQIKRYLGQPAGYQVIRWDAPAHGQTDLPEDTRSLNFSNFAEILADLLAHLEIGKAILGGISMGAATTATYCCRWPQRVRAAILIRPAWAIRPHPPSLEILELAGQLLTERTPEDARHAFVHSAQYQRLQVVAPTAAAQLMEHFDESNIKRCIRLLRLPSSAPIQNWQEIAAHTIPALVVNATNDPFHPFEVAQQWAKHWPSSKLVSIPSAFEEAQIHTVELRRVINDFLQSLELSNPC